MAQVRQQALDWVAYPCLILNTLKTELLAWEARLKPGPYMKGDLLFITCQGSYLCLCARGCSGYKFSIMSGFQLDPLHTLLSLEQQILLHVHALPAVMIAGCWS